MGRFPITTPLHHTGQSFNICVHWPSPMNSAIMGVLHITLLPCTPKPLPFASRHHTAKAGDNPLPTLSHLSPKTHFLAPT